jgi:hypothetical protein
LRWFRNYINCRGCNHLYLEYRTYHEYNFCVARKHNFVYGYRHNRNLYKYRCRNCHYSSSPNSYCHQHFRLSRRNWHINCRRGYNLYVEYGSHHNNDKCCSGINNFLYCYRHNRRVYQHRGWNNYCQPNPNYYGNLSHYLCRRLNHIYGRRGEYLYVESGNRIKRHHRKRSYGKSCVNNCLYNHRRIRSRMYGHRNRNHHSQSNPNDYGCIAHNLRRHFHFVYCKRSKYLYMEPGNRT